ncbi:hypothetical protein CFK39_06930 [Brachybacterium avium]|uniref:TraB/GumN family protein n=1 Tax=Brachybacterium avium TaxID=2017485 RepID=A0A220UD15_9MICO|nr:hypothetical protein [Brachybacterium avium]ASK65613.1 hypothetical protein CFK39_06930 [Brachybacterium avium]
MTAGASSRSTELLIVPTAHLTASTPDSVVSHARDRLLAWRPDLIAVEALPGELVVQYEQRSGGFADFSVGGAPHARRGAELVGAGPEVIWSSRYRALDVSVAVRDRVLAWLGAREPLNALLLPYERADLPADVADFLEELASGAWEAVRIGAQLGRTLGHSSLVHVDDHPETEGSEISPSDMERVFAAQKPRISELLDELEVPDAAPQDLWAQWRFHATPRARQLFERLESAEWVAAEAETPRAHRVILALWRARNLAMAARLRAASAAVPGGRMVLIVGAAHEMPLRTALGAGQYDLRLVELEELGT